MTRSIVDKDVLLDGASFFKDLRRDKPVYLDDDLGMFVVTRNEEINYVLKQPQTFSLAAGIAHDYPFHDVVVDVMTREGMGPFERILPQAEPPEHTRVRTLTSKGFSMPRIAKLNKLIDAFANHFLDQIISAGEADMSEAFARPLALAVIGHLLGMPAERYEQVHDWSQAWTAASVGGFSTREQAEAAARALVQMQLYLAEQLRERRQTPADDVMTDLINARSNDYEPLTDKEIIAFGAHMLGAGHETTAVAITSAIKVLAENPEQFSALKSASDRTSAIRAFCEELLRIEPPTNMMSRVAMTDAQVGGVDIPAGSKIAMIVGSANRDESVFAEAPDEFRPGRAGASRLMTFGGGVHVCLGSMLARAELASAVNALVERIDHLELARELTFEDYRKVVYPTNFRPHRLVVRYRPHAS